MRSLLRWTVLGLAIALAALVMALSGAQAAPVRPLPQAPSAPVQINSNQQCLDCHTKPDQTLYLTIDQAGFEAGLHAKAEPSVGCMGCHTDITGYPHGPLAAKNLREVAISFSKVCATCHDTEAAKQLDSMHQHQLDAGNENAAVCSDCHNPHYTVKPDEPRARIANTCARGHSGIAQEYRNSVHGQDLFQGDNPDVPVCITCHGVHNIQDPRTAKFLLYSPDLCKKCHGNLELMRKYGIRTEVFDTYVADFHGTTVTLFQRITPDQVPNKPLCIDCHGVHSMQRVNDQPQSIRENLLTTCQKCHPGATPNFPDAWLSHYPPSPDRYPLVYFVNLFYQVFIPGVLGGMAIFVAADAYRRITRRLKGGRA
jgi:hypothetical protein